MLQHSHREPAGSLGAQLQALRLGRGWNMDRVAAAAGISRTTLFHLERDAIRRPRASTLHKLALALEVPVERFTPRAPGRAPVASERRGRRVAVGAIEAFAAENAPATDGGDIPERLASRRLPQVANGASNGDSHALDAGRAFDRATNPVVTAIAGEQPQLFVGWTLDEWDELYSQFGVGGPLSEQGVLTAAARINRHRETVYRLRIVLQTHLAQVADGLIETLYRQVCAGPAEIEGVAEATVSSPEGAPVDADSGNL
ncbi:MAG: helix-turn-helix domain-containing protein [Planctomycetaceae bacterium]